jgi:hypothetical protein
MINQDNNQARNDDSANQAPVAVPTNGGDDMTTQTTTETAAPTTQRSPGSEPAEAPKPKKKGNGGNGYPFRSKRAILAQLAEDPAFVLQCLQIMDARQTDDEREVKETKYKNRRGWMSSHAVNGTTLAAKARSEGLTDEEFGKAQAMVSRYGKQLASHFRNEALAADPDLADKAACYFGG